MDQKKLGIYGKIKNHSLHINRSLVEALLKNEGSAICLLIMFVFASLHYDEFFLTARNLENLLQNASIIGIIALGMTMVILTAGIDLSVGSIFALSGVVVAINIDLDFLTAVSLGPFNGLICE